MLRIAICDDEIPFCALLQEKVSAILAHMSEAFTLQTYTSTYDLQCAALPFDVLFLDIKMPIQDGLQYAKVLRAEGNDCAIVFVSAYPTFVFDAFPLEASDFLCKPIDNAKLRAVLLRILQKQHTEDNSSLLIQTNQWCKSIKLSSIVYCEVINRTIYLHTTREVIQYYGKLTDLEKQLDARFYRCHRSYLVNLDFVTSYADGEIRLDNAERVPVSRSRKKEFMKYMLQYMKRRNSQ